jgi:hypothetical protein
MEIALGCFRAKPSEKCRGGEFRSPKGGYLSPLRDSFRLQCIFHIADWKIEKRAKRSILDGTHYAIRTGGAGRMMPNDRPDWKTL